MSDAETSERPRQLTTAAGFVIVGSVLLVLAVFDRLSALESVDTRDAVTQMLRDLDGLDISVGAALTAMRIGLNVAAVCAAAAAVLGVFVLQRHRGARVALGVLGVPILLTAPLTGSFLGAVVVVAIATLWSGPARDWYAGRIVRQPPPRADASGRPDPMPPPASQDEAAVRPTPSTGSTSATPPPSRGYGEVPAATSGTPSTQTTSSQAVAAQGEPPQPTLAPGERPWPAYPPGAQRLPTPIGIKIACVLTWVFSVVVVVVVVVAMVAVTRDSSGVLSDLRAQPAVERAGLTADGLLATMWFVVVMFACWAAAAMVLAWFVWRRHDWARYLLVVSAAAVLVAATFAFPVGVPLQLACAATIVLLVNRPARSWFGAGTRPPERPLW